MVCQNMALDNRNVVQQAEVLRRDETTSHMRVSLEEDFVVETDVVEDENLKRRDNYFLK